MDETQLKRLEAKTPQQKFLQILEQAYRFAPRIAAAILSEAQDWLQGSPERLQTGQVRVILARRHAPGGRAMAATPTLAVTWTVDAGLEDRQVQHQHGRRALRQVRIQRLLDEALAQGAVATQEDLALGLHTSLRTIKRDFAELEQQGIYLPTRGNLQGIGRGQTHKAQILARWLAGETYDQLALHTHHCATSIQRYVQTFLRVVALQRQGFSPGQLALLLQIGPPLVAEYLAVYQQCQVPEQQARLEAHLARLQQAIGREKGGA
jgi:hypothetical protein